MKYDYIPPRKAQHLVRFNGWEKVYTDLWSYDETTHIVSLNQDIKTWLSQHDSKAKIAIDRGEENAYAPIFSIYFSNKKAANAFVEQFGRLDELAKSRRSVDISGLLADEIFVLDGKEVKINDVVNNWLTKYAAGYELITKIDDDKPMGTFVFTSENETIEFTKYLARL